MREPLNLPVNAGLTRTASVPLIEFVHRAPLRHCLEIHSHTTVAFSAARIGGHPTYRSPSRGHNRTRRVSSSANSHVPITAYVDAAPRAFFAPISLYTPPQTLSATRVLHARASLHHEVLAGQLSSISIRPISLECRLGGRSTLDSEALAVARAHSRTLPPLGAPHAARAQLIIFRSSNHHLEPGYLFLYQLQ